MPAKNSEERLEFGISPTRKFENANLLAEEFPLFPCPLRKEGLDKQKKLVKFSTKGGEGVREVRFSTKKKRLKTQDFA